MPKLFTSIHDLPFHIFRDIILDGDLKLLVVEGDCAEMELKETWQVLLEQYTEALGEQDKDSYISTSRELLYYETQRMLVDGLVGMLKEYYTPKWAALLGKIVDMQFPYESDAQLFKQLDKALARSRGLIDINIQLLKTSLEEIEKKKAAQGGDNEKPTREYFAKVLMNLHEFANWQFDDEKLSVFQYCEMVRRYQQHITYMETLKAKHK